MGELRALGPAGGAGGVEDDRGVVVGALVRLGDRVAPSRAPSTGPMGPHSTMRVPEPSAPLVASGTKSGQTKAILAPESVKK